MKAVHFPQANKALKAPPSRRAEIQKVINQAAEQAKALGVDIDIPWHQARLDAQFPREQEVYDLHVWGGEVDGAERCISRWEPSLEERARLAAGGPVWLWVVGHTHPPLALGAESPFEESAPAPRQTSPNEHRWLVVICREGVPEITRFEVEGEAREFFNRASMQWSDSFLAEVKIGPGPSWRSGS